MTDEMLRVKAREAVLAGRLPNRRPERIWGGPGIGARCAVCDEAIERSQPEFELQFSQRSQNETLGGSSGEVSYHVHVGCFAAWESERQNRRALPVEAAIGFSLGAACRSTCRGDRGITAARAGAPERARVAGGRAGHLLQAARNG